MLPTLYSSAEFGQNCWLSLRLWGVRGVDTIPANYAVVQRSWTVGSYVFYSVCPSVRLNPVWCGYLVEHFRMIVFLFIVLYVVAEGM